MSSVGTISKTDIGAVVNSIMYGVGTIIEVNNHRGGSTYPVEVKYNESPTIRTYTLEGRYQLGSPDRERDLRSILRDAKVRIELVDMDRIVFTVDSELIQVFFKDISKVRTNELYMTSSRNIPIPNEEVREEIIRGILCQKSSSAETLT